MTATKIQPGDDLHLTSLMAPHSLNLVTGQDRAALLAYGRDVFAAARDSKCLAQIEEPAQPIAGYRISDPSDADIDAALLAFDWDGWTDQKKAMHAFTREALARWAAAPALEAPAAPGCRPLTEQEIINRFDFLEGVVNEHYYLKIVKVVAGIQAAALAAAPQAPAAPVVDDEGCLSDELRDLITGMTVSVDVSTGEHDAGNRLFGEVSEVMEYDGGSDKHKVVLLVQSPEANFKAAPAAPILGDAERLAAARQDKSLADYWRNRVAGLAEEFTTAEAALYLADRIVADLYDLPQAGVARPAAPAAPAVDARDTARMNWLEAQVVNVRAPLRYGSRDMFWASPEEVDGGPDGPSDLRARIDAAQAAAKGA